MWVKMRFCSQACANEANRRDADATFEASFEVDEVTGCHNWTGTLSGARYGQLYVQGKRRYAHRYAYERVNGRIPAGMEVCHRCDNPQCVNEEHLFVGSHADNMADASAKRRTRQGSRHWGAKLTEDDVAFLRSSGLATATLARRFGVERATIRNAREGRTWRHLPMPEIKCEAA
jgi:hypothetical protein